GYVIARVSVIALRVPFLGCGLVEFGIGKETQADDAGRVPVQGADRHVVAAGAHGYTGIFLLVLKRIRRTVGPTLVEPQPVAGRVGTSGLFETGFVHQT